MNEIRERVRQHYADKARQAGSGASCCGDGCGCGVDEAAGGAIYAFEDLRDVPEPVVLASLGCGNPIAVAELREGETVLDLGSGGGIDVMLSARRVGPTGKAYGLDMTDEMLALARKAAADAGIDNVEFLQGYIEDVPLPDASVDVVISNCVINLSVDKPRVFDEIARVLRTGGRVGLTDIVADDRLTPHERAERGDFVGCIAGAMSMSEVRAELDRAGLVDVEIRPTDDVADGMHSAIVRARKP
jgi:arsenite methyltransferase